MALIIISPVILIIAVVLVIWNGGAVWFVQERPGKNGKLFRLIKFKTMNEHRDTSGNLLSDEHRLTSLGKFLRRTSLDELPQLFNVVAGNMSFVGPRPLLKEYVPLYNDRQRRRMAATPGITGWAQVNGRNFLTWEQKFEYDVWYVENMSFWLDIKILFLTVIKVLRAEGISSERSATMEKFSGSK